MCVFQNAIFFLLPHVRPECPADPPRSFSPTGKKPTCRIFYQNRAKAGNPAIAGSLATLITKKIFFLP